MTLPKLGGKIEATNFQGGFILGEWEGTWERDHARQVTYTTWSYAATSQGSPRATRSRKNKEGSSPRGFRESMVLLRPEFWTSSLQSCERINVCKPVCGTSL